MKNIYSILGIILLVLFSSCISDQNVEGIRVDPGLAASLLSEAADTVEINGNTYTFEASLWRDLMPGSADNETGLIALNYLINTDGTAIPAGLELTKQYVIMGDTLWISDYSVELRPVYSDRLERISREGPEWSPGKMPHVVAEITDSLDHSTYLIKKMNVQIFAAY